MENINYVDFILKTRHMLLRGFFGGTVLPNATWVKWRSYSVSKWEEGRVLFEQYLKPLL